MAAAQPLATVTLPDAPRLDVPYPRLPADCTMPQLDREKLHQRFGQLISSHREQKPGALIAELTFVSATEPPQVRFIFDAGDKRLADLARQAMEEYRLDCVKPGTPVKATQEFKFIVAGDPSARLKRNLQLVDLVRLAPPAKLERVKLDTQEMQCPFELKFAPYRPWMRNGVAEVGEPNARRQPLLKFLADLELDLPPATMRTAIGQVSIIEVPCAVIDLT